MQRDPTESFPNETSVDPSHSTPPALQHGLPHDPLSPATLFGPGQGSCDPHDDSPSSEWSLSPPPTLESPSGQDTWLNSYERLGHESVQPSLRRDEPVDDDYHQSAAFPAALAKSNVTTSNDSQLLAFPEEILIHVLSHLPAETLLTVKAVCRRFYVLLKSPNAWMNAFTRHFPGMESISMVPGATTTGDDVRPLLFQKRVFTRLTSIASWRNEYLVRTRLLRCLERGRPSLPFAAPCPGKPGRGSAVFTFSSRLGLGCTNMHADFGSPMDKRKPQFIHGLDNGSVTSSDRKGKFGSWGLTETFFFRRFEELHPDHFPYGRSPGLLVGMPNMMDVSQSHGMVYGEGTPDGHVFYLAPDQKRGRYLSPFLHTSFPHLGVPKIYNANQSICSVWIAKAKSVPIMTDGLIGILSGSSCGVVSAYSLGLPGTRDTRLHAGQLTCRWMVSPGIPIVSIKVDEQYDENRAKGKRVWIVAMNALGEVYYLTDVPVPQTLVQTPPELRHHFEHAVEVYAWLVGRSASWKLVLTTARKERHMDSDQTLQTSSEKLTAWSGDGSGAIQNVREMESRVKKSPKQIQSEFQAWDMRRFLEVDFAGDDAQGAGEQIVVINTKLDSEPVSLKRHTRSKLLGEELDPADPSNFDAKNETRDAWQMSTCVFGDFKPSRLTASALDMSRYAVTTALEDCALHSRHVLNNPNFRDDDEKLEEHDALVAPGQRARLLAIGTSEGNIFVWNMRASNSKNYDYPIQPIRIIPTDSLGISSLALTSLYLVHGGEEGLVQAWDILASKTQPIRTLSSRHAINSRRRVIIARQQNLEAPHPPAGGVPQQQQSLAAGPICLDPDPTILRGIVAIGPFLKYWSFSSTASADETTKSQKRRLNRAARGVPGPNENYSTTRRIGLKSLVEEELRQRNLDQKEQERQKRMDQRFAGRFGLDLLGQGATDEELLAYAKLLSEEELAASGEGKEGRYQSGGKTGLTDEDMQRWKFAGWKERFEMGGMVDPRGANVGMGKSDGNTDDDVARALEASLNEGAAAEAESTSARPSTSDFTSDSVEDDDTLEAIARSLDETDLPSSAPNSSERPQRGPAPHAPRSSVDNDEDDDDDDDDLARAIKLSLEEQPSGGGLPGLEGRSEDEEVGRQRLLDEEFPALGGGASTGGETWKGSWRGNGKVKNKGKGRGGA